MTTETMHNAVANIRDLVHHRCVGCSFGNENGLHLESDAADDGGVTATFQCNQAFEGYSGILHGKVISSILDGAGVTACLRTVEQP